MAITVLYQECGSGCQEVPGDLGSSGSSYSGGRGNYYNAFELAPTSGGRMVTVADLVKAFPLGPSYHFDIMRRDGVFESIHELDLGSPVPILANGVITCRVFKLACPPGYASGGMGRMLTPEGEGGGNGGFDSSFEEQVAGVGRNRPEDGQQKQHGHQTHHHHRVNVVKAAAKTTKVAAKTTKGLLGYVGSVAQRTVESLTHQEVTIGLRRVQIVKEMAEGGFSTVFLVRDVRTRECLAMKRMLCQQRETTAAAYREVQVLRAVRHRNVISLVDQVSAPSKTHPGAREFFLLFPFYERGTVWDAIVKAKEEGPPWPYPEPKALRVFLDACRGINAMHSHGYAHRDIKPLNLLVANDGTCVVMDVGSACSARREVSTRQEALLLEDEASSLCSMPYRPPELTSVKRDSVVDERVDVWALGCTLYAMAFGHSPFETPRDGVSKLAILNGAFSFPRGGRGPHGDEYSKGFCDLVSWTLTVDQASRPRCPEVIQRAQEIVKRR
ncbi:unnamed protein product [Ascophyllum nodosum]